MTTDIRRVGSFLTWSSCCQQASCQAVVDIGMSGVRGLEMLKFNLYFYTLYIKFKLILLYRRPRRNSEVITRTRDDLTSVKLVNQRIC